MAQLVGQNCVRCGERIPNELDSRFCPTCGSPVHIRCMSPADSSGCPTCGAPGRAAPVSPSPPPRRPSRPNRPSQSWPQHLRQFLATFYGLAVVWGCCSALRRQPFLLDVALWLAINIALVLWAIADARYRRRPIPLLSRPWFFLFAWLLVPAYLVESRRWRGAAYLALHAICWFAVATAAAIACGITLSIAYRSGRIGG